MAGTIVANTLNTDTGLFSTQNAYNGIAKAWLRYNGATQAILGSFNVSSVTYTSTGNYTINFITAMPNANYSFACSGSMQDGTANAVILSVGSYRATSPTTTALVIQASYVNGLSSYVGFDGEVNVSVFSS